MNQNGERVTRADVAKEAGVSETIVSYVVNNNRYVAKDKRTRVEEAIAKLHYRPNNVARALKGKRSNQLLFIADQITNEYFSRIVSEMDKYAYEAGFLIHSARTAILRNLCPRLSAVSMTELSSVLPVFPWDMSSTSVRPGFRFSYLNTADTINYLRT